MQRRFNQVIFGHGRQLWGLAAHPEDELFATAGHDKNIALWRRHKLIWTSTVSIMLIAVRYSHKFKFLLSQFRSAMNVFHSLFIHLEVLWLLAAVKAT